MVQLGTISHEDIYGPGSLDTLNERPGTSEQTNPNDPEASGVVKQGQESIFHIKGNILGQPLFIWFALVGLLVGLKYLTENVLKD